MIQIQLTENGNHDSRSQVAARVEGGRRVHRKRPHNHVDGEANEETKVFTRKSAVLIVHQRVDTDCEEARSDDLIEDTETDVSVSQGDKDTPGGIDEEFTPIVDYGVLPDLCPVDTEDTQSTEESAEHFTDNVDGEETDSESTGEGV